MLSIETNGLSKHYASFAALDDCTLRVPQGVVYGLLGPNGAGKTTLIRTLLGFIRPTTGRATVCGFDCVAQSLQVREQVSYLPADARLYRSMRGRDVIDLFAGLHRNGDAGLGNSVAQRLELDVSRRVMFMSTGMRQKLAIAVVLGCNAPLIVLDEPTANLDPNVRGEVLRLIREVRDRGNTVVLSSHIFSDIDESCDHVAILRRGRLVAEQDMHSLQETHIATIAPLSIEQIADATKLPSAGQPAFLKHVFSTSNTCQLYLIGPPSQWLLWLAELDLPVAKVEKAGIQAIYAQHHIARQSCSQSASQEVEVGT